MIKKRNLPLEVFIDGASKGNPGPSGIGIVIVDKDKRKEKSISRYIGETTNNISEYLAFIYALQEILPLGIKNITVKSDSQLLIKQLKGEFKVKDRNIKFFFDIAKHLVEKFANVNLIHIGRNENSQADRLASKAAGNLLDLKFKSVSKKSRWDDRPFDFRREESPSSEGQSGR